MSKVYDSIQELNGGVPASNINPELAAYDRQYTASYKKLGKYDTGLLLGMNQERLRAANQTGWDMVANGGGRLIASTLAKTFEGISSMFTLFDENPVSKSIAEAEKHILDEWFPIYKTAGAESDNLMDRLKSGSWWASTGVDGAAFFLSSVLGTKGINAITKIPKLARLAKTLGASDDLLMSLDKIQRSTVGKILALDKPGIAFTTGYNAFNEAGFEARAVMEKVKADLSKEKYGTEYEYLNEEQKAFVDDVAGNQASNSFWYNVPMLLLSERIFSETILGNFFGLPEASAFKRLVKDGSAVSLKNLSMKQKAALVGLPFAVNIPSEAFQELYQVSLENYFTERGRLGQKMDFLDSENLKGIGRGMIENLSTIEGKESMFLGGLLGGVGSLATLGGIGKSEKKAQEYIDILNKGITNLNKSGVRFFKTKDDGSILFDENGIPVRKTDDEIKKEYESLADDYSKFLYSTTVNMFNESGGDISDIVELDRSNNIKELSFHFFQTEGGRELFDKFLDEYAEKIKNEYGDNYADKNVDDIKKELRQEVDKLESLYNLANKYYKIENVPGSLSIQYHSLWKQSQYQKMADKYRDNVRGKIKNLPDDVRYKIEDILDRTDYYNTQVKDDINSIIDNLTKKADTKIPGYDSLLLNADLKKLISLDSLYRVENAHFKKELTDPKYYDNLSEIQKKIEETRRKIKETEEMIAVDAEDIAARELENDILQGVEDITSGKSEEFKSVEDVQKRIDEIKSTGVEGNEVELQRLEGIKSNLLSRGSQGQSTPVEEQPLTSKETISNEEYELFISKGVVSEKILNFIANKIKNNEKLTDREIAIFNDKTSEINEILKKLSKVETKDVDTKQIKSDILNILKGSSKLLTTISRNLNIAKEKIQNILEELIQEGKVIKEGNLYKKVNKKELPLGKVGNTDYEVKKDGVYYKNEKIKNPNNLSNEKLIKNHIDDRKKFKFLNDNDGKQVIINGKKGTLKKINNFRFELETNDTVFEYQFNEIKSFSVLSKKSILDKYNVEIVSETEVVVNGVPYTINLNKLGNVESVSPTNKPNQKITNEQLLIAVDIARNKMEYKTEDEVVNDILDELREQFPNIDKLLNSVWELNMTETIAEALDKLYNDKPLTESEKLSTAIWLRDVFDRISILMGKTKNATELEILLKAYNTAEIINDILYNTNNININENETESNRATDIGQAQSNVSNKKSKREIRKQIKKEKERKSQEELEKLKEHKDSYTFEVELQEVEDAIAEEPSISEEDFETNIEIEEKLPAQETIIEEIYEVGKEIQPTEEQLPVEPQLPTVIADEIVVEEIPKEIVDAVKGEDGSEVVTEEVLENYEEEVAVNEKGEPVINKLNLQGKVVKRIGKFIEKGFNKLGMRVVKMVKTVVSTEDSVLVTREDMLDEKGEFIKETSKFSSTAYMHSKVRKENKITIRVPDNYMDYPIYTDYENNKTITFKELLEKTNPEELYEVIIDNLPLEILHEGKVFIGNVHIVNWLNQTNVNASEADLEVQKEILRTFRKSFVNEDATVNKDVSFETTIKEKSTGLFFKSVNKKPTSEALPNHDVFIITKNKQAFNIITNKVLEDVKISNKMKPGFVGTVSNGIFVPLEKAELTQEEKLFLISEISKPENRDMTVIRSMLNIESFASKEAFEKQKSKFKDNGIIFFIKNDPGFYVYDKSVITYNDIKSLTNYVNKRKLVHIDVNNSQFNKDWVLSKTVTNLRELEANYDGDVEYTVFLHPIIEFDMDGKLNVSQFKKEKLSEEDLDNNVNSLLDENFSIIPTQDSVNLRNNCGSK